MTFIKKTAARALFALSCILLFHAAAAHNAAAAEMFSLTFKEIYLAQGGKWGIRFTLKNNYPDKDIISFSSLKGEYLSNGKRRTFSMTNPEYTLKNPLPPGKSTTFSLTLSSQTDPRTVTGVKVGSVNHATRSSSPPRSRTPAPKPPAPKPPKYIASLQAMNPKDNYILWGLLSISRVDKYNWKVTGHIINNYNDREIIAINSGNMVYAAGIHGYDRGVRTKGMNKFIFPNPVKPGTRIQFNIPINDTNVSSFAWQNCTFATRKIQDERRNGRGTKIIIRN